jgi:hypothetical protein
MRVANIRAESSRHGPVLPPIFPRRAFRGGCMSGNTAQNGLTLLPLHVIKVSFVPTRLPVVGVFRMQNAGL